MSTPTGGGHNNIIMYYCCLNPAKTLAQLLLGSLEFDEKHSSKELSTFKVTLVTFHSQFKHQPNQLFRSQIGKTKKPLKNNQFQANSISWLTLLFSQNLKSLIPVHLKLIQAPNCYNCSVFPVRTPTKLLQVLSNLYKHTLVDSQVRVTRVGNCLYVAKLINCF